MTRLAMIAHDLKTPLTIIRARAQMIRRRIDQSELADREQIQEAFGQIESATERIEVLLAELMSISLPTEQADEPHHETTDLARLAQSLAAVFEQMSDRHRISVHLQQGDYIGRWRRVHVERILSNLLSNAMKYSPRGGEIALSVWAEVDRADGARWALVRVTDKGIGIPADDLPHVFTPRHRAKNAFGSAAGEGLGLAAVRELVRLYDGTVTVQSHEGRGSSFTVRLPLERMPSPTCAR